MAVEQIKSSVRKQIGKVFFHYLKKSMHAHIVVYAGLGSHIFKKKNFFQKYEYAKYLLMHIKAINSSHVARFVF